MREQAHRNSGTGSVPYLFAQNLTPIGNQHLISVANDDNDDDGDDDDDDRLNVRMSPTAQRQDDDYSHTSNLYSFHSQSLFLVLVVDYSLIHFIACSKRGFRLHTVFDSDSTEEAVFFF